MGVAPRMDLAQVTKKIDRFRSRVRGLIFAFGLFRTIAAAASLLLLSFLLDTLLQLPLTVRYVSFFLALGGISWVAAMFLVRPLRIKLPDDDLALAAEARLPDLKDRLISALQFKRQIEDPENAESKAMMRAVIEEAGQLEGVLEIRRLVDTKKVKLQGLLALAITGALAAICIFSPVTADIWAKRNLLLRDIPWPRDTTLVVTGFPESGEIVLTRGETLRVNVRAQGSIPDNVEIFFEPTEGDNRAESRRRMYQVEQAPRQFRFEFRQIPASFRFWVNGGDDDDGVPVYTVKALIPPLITEIAARCEFPAYTAMPPQTLAEGDLEIPMGTRVELTFRTNMALRRALLTIEDRDPAPLLTADDGRRITTSFIADRTFGYSLELTGREGQKSLPDSAVFRVRAIQDRKPKARILYPTARPWYTTQAIVPVKLLVSDNYGVSRISLFYRKGPEGEYAERRFTADELSAALGAKEIVAYAAIPAVELASDPENPIRIGDEISYYAEAEDNNGNIDRTDPFRIEIASPEAIESRLSQQQRKLRVNAMKTRRDEQDPARRLTNEVLEFLSGAGALEPRDRERIRDIQVRQGTVTRQMQRFFTTVANVFNSFAYNRLTNPPATERVLLLFDDYLRTDHQNLSRVFKRDLYRLLIEDYRTGGIRDQQTLAVLIEIMEITLKISENTSPTAQRLLAGIARGEPDQGIVQDLSRVRDLQTDILADFDLLDRKMREWETYAEIIQIVRELRGTEERIRSGADSLKNLKRAPK